MIAAKTWCRLARLPLDVSWLNDFRFATHERWAGRHLAEERCATEDLGAVRQKS